MKRGVLFTTVLLLAAFALVVDAKTLSRPESRLAKAVEPELVQATRNNGWGYSFSGALDELKHAFVASIIGIVMCCIAFPCLYWNEGRCVTREMVLGKARDEAKDVGSVDKDTKPTEKSNAGDLIRFAGKPFTTSSLQSDTELGVASDKDVHAWRVNRTVQMKAYVEDTYTEQRETGKTDSDGNYTKESVTCYREPKLEWVNVDFMSANPRGPIPGDMDKSKCVVYDGSNGTTDCRNIDRLGLTSTKFSQGSVFIGPYKLQQPMYEYEMVRNNSSLTPNAEEILAFVAAGPQPLSAEDLKSEDPITKDDGNSTSKDDANETTGLLAQEGSGTGSGSGMSAGSILGSSSKKFIQENSGDFKVESNYAYFGKSSPSDGAGNHQDYRINWSVDKLPTMSDGATQEHTVLAKQSEGSQPLAAWVPADAEDFELDSCCGVVCCIGYKFVAESPNGCGCISAIDGVVFQNAAAEADHVDLETGEKVSVQNVNKVEKCVSGNVTINSIIKSLEGDNNAKTDFYRKAGFLLMFLGFQLVMDPLPTLFHFIPFIGKAIGFFVWIAVFLVALALGCFGSITTISVAWLRYRPLWGILGITVAGAIAVGICFASPP